MILIAWWTDSVPRDITSPTITATLTATAMIGYRATLQAMLACLFIYLVTLAQPNPPSAPTATCSANGDSLSENATPTPNAVQIKSP